MSAASVAASGAPNRSSFQIEVVHDGAMRSTDESSIAEHRAQRLERAAIPVMTELDAEHVERERAARLRDQVRPQTRSAPWDR
jgi:hypothetical protein